MRIVLLGAPGSGKKTQTRLMVERYGIPAISTGELLKAQVAKATPLDQQTRESLEQGRQITEELVLELIRARLLEPDANQGFVLDGFPRNILQAITLDELLYEMQLPIELVLLLDIEHDVLMERLVGRRSCISCGAQYNIYVRPTAVEGVCDLCGGGLRHRADDNEETISSRLHVYEHLVAPLIKHYSRQHKLIRVDGGDEVEAVFARLCQAVDNYVPPADTAGRADAPTADANVVSYPMSAADEASPEAPGGQPRSGQAKKTAGRRQAGAKGTDEQPAGDAKKTPVRKAAGGRKSAAKKTSTHKTSSPAADAASGMKKLKAVDSSRAQRPRVTKKTPVKKVQAKKAGSTEESEPGRHKKAAAHPDPAKKASKKKSSIKKQSVPKAARKS